MRPFAPVLRRSTLRRALVCALAGLALACERGAPPPAAPAPPADWPQPAPQTPAQNPREKADDLYNAAMMAFETGDRATAEPAIALAIMAYRSLGEPDADALYHVSTLQYAAGKYAESRATAEQILREAPDHLLALGGAGRSAAAQGDAAGARRYWERYLQAYEKPAARPEYSHHERILPVYERQAREALRKP